MSAELAWLLGDGDAPDELGFPSVDVPPELERTTLAAVERAWVAERRRPWWLAAGVAAAAVLAVWGPRPEPVGDLAQMVPRGADSRPVVVDLKMAAGVGGALGRVRAGEAYGASSELFFRVSVDLPSEVALARVSSDGAALLHQAGVSGEGDLALDGHPLSWTVEAGDSASLFVVVAATDLAGVEAWLDAATMDGAALCATASSRGWGCDFQRVDVP